MKVQRIVVSIIDWEGLSGFTCTWIGLFSSTAVER